MIRLLRDTCGLLLAALIMITALHVGTVRGQAQVAGSIVLCTGAGPVTVAVDSDGQPVGQAAHCPDCVMSSLVAPDAPATVARRLAPARCLRFGPTRVSGRFRAGRRHRARGPPLSS